jgi:hypothetical protein
MKIKNKSLLIHHDSATDETSSIIIDEKDVVEKTKEFLEKIATAYKNAEVNVYHPLGIVLKAADNEQEYAHAVAYEKEKFVIVEPNGTSDAAKLYGDWNEAIACAQRLLTGTRDPNKKIRFILDKYIKENE